jgi:creatinine amidohydrolase
MNRIVVGLVCVLSVTLKAQSLSPHWADLTADDFKTALRASTETCALPFGIIEKHGPSGPLGTDLINVREVTARAAAREYVVIFPEYYVGQIAEARHQPGTVAYSTVLQLQVLQETVAEMGRNGCRKIVIVNGHGGNTLLITHFLQSQLESPKDYVVYAVSGSALSPNAPSVTNPSRPGVDGHAGESEISRVMAARPNVAHPERAGQESGAAQKTLTLPDGVDVAIRWYATFPNHYMGDAAGATAARGNAIFDAAATRLAASFQAIKADDISPRLQREFFERSKDPSATVPSGILK